MDQNYNIDLERKDRLGFPEIVFGENKRSETIIEIIKTALPTQGNVLITRLQVEKFPQIQEQYPSSFYDPVSGVCLIGDFPDTNLVSHGVAILSGGTSDEFVVNEAYYTLRYLGIETERFHDVGAAGIHRLLRREKEIRPYQVLIVAAGFEGALATVAGGLFRQPIIGVPTSIGYYTGLPEAHGLKQGHGRAFAQG